MFKNINIFFKEAFLLLKNSALTSFNSQSLSVLRKRAYFNFFLVGVLEVMPLKFSCLSVSEGSKFEQLKSSTVKSSNKKEANNHHEPSIFNQQQVRIF